MGSSELGPIHRRTAPKCDSFGRAEATTKGGLSEKQGGPQPCIQVFVWFDQELTVLAGLLSDDASITRLTLQGNKMLSDVDIYRAAHLMMHEYGNNAEREAARCADRMLGGGDREELLNWFRIGRTIAVMRQAPTGLPN